MKKRDYRSLILTALLSLAALIWMLPRDAAKILAATVIVSGWVLLQGRLLRRVEKLEKRSEKSEKTLKEMPYVQRLLRNTQKQIDTFIDSLSNGPGNSRPFTEVFYDSLRKAQKMRPTRIIPPHLLSAYTMGGKIRVQEKYRDSAYSPETPLVYEKERINSYVEQIKTKTWCFPRYGKTNLWLFDALEKYPIRGKTAVLMGSNKPWFESVVLFYGAKCTTIEYNRILCDHPDVQIITPEEYDKNPVRYDAGLSISSFEHDGLGRFGDPLNPSGDLEAMQKMKSMLKPGALLFLAVPVGTDALLWNANRVYGRLRLPMLLDGWKNIDSFGFEEPWLDKEKNSYEPVFVLQNPG